MINKKILFTLLFLFLLIFSLSHVSAADDLDNITSTPVEDTPVEVNATENLASDRGTYTELDQLVYDYYEIELEKDYEYDSQVDDEELSKGVIIGHELILNGNNHTIYGNGARFFNVYDVNQVYIYNLNFVNIYSPDFLKEYDGNCMYYGGGIINEGVLYFENCTFVNNFALVLGGAILSTDNSTLYVSNCHFLNNSVLDINGVDDLDTSGGSICSYGQLAVFNTSFNGSSGYQGGAIASFFDSYIWHSHFENCIATTNGGAIYNHKQNSSDVYNCTFKANNAAYGGALYNTVATKCIFDNDNHADTKKGHNMNGGVNVDCESENNSSEYFYDVIFSESFSFVPISLVYNKTDDVKLQILVKSNPTDEAVSGIWLNVRLEDENGDYAYYLLISDENGIASLPLSSFKNGTYKMSVSFVNKEYNDTEGNYNIILGKVKSKISFSTSIVFEYGKVGTIFVEVEGGTLEKKNIMVVNHPEAKITLSGAMVSISGLKVGNYILRVTSTPDENHSAGSGEISITVKKAVAVIKASKLTVALKKGTIWTIKLVDSKNNKPIGNMELTLKIYTGKKYKTLKGITNSKGEFKYKTSSLTKGTHKIIVSATHSGYTFNTLTSSIKVIKPKALVFKLKKRVNDKEGSLISYIVKDKKTKKGVNGVKIKLLIYTGKKYKVVTLKTKKSGKYKGAMGFATNDLSVGKHKVVIMPASIKYSGSAKTTMIIKKAAKKRQTYSHKL